ncbi:MAG TPA: hypothetical protein VJ997_01055, partial [Longimicrobiales bacterium]|nr:hypothetical protein [Longimicrobiales bacterium]
MISFTIALLSAFLVGLVTASGLRLRARLLRRSGGAVPVVDDDAVRRILEEGVFEVDVEPPLDLDEIEDEERRFWSERWD